MSRNDRISETIILLLEGKNQEEIAKALNVAVITIRRLTGTEKFKKVFAEAREKIFSEALQELKTLSREAAKTLKDLLLMDHKDTARLGSAKTIFELAIKNKEIEDLEKRIEALEKRLEV
jgi:transposase